MKEQSVSEMARPIDLLEQRKPDFSPGEAKPGANDELGATKHRADQADAVGLQSCVVMSVSANDPTVLEARIDRAASRKRIVKELRGELRRFAVPYRQDLDPQVLRAVRVYLEEGATFEQASICVFGDPKHARAIRYWGLR
jgi:hypothetical protein